MTIFEKIYTVTSSIPKGKVSTYKQIADILGIKNPRIVGFALNKNKKLKKVPCHRVIKNNGTIAKGYAFGGKEKQIEKLKKEGVRFVTKEKVDFKKSLYNFILPL